MYRIKQKIIYNQLPSSLISSYTDVDGAALKVALYLLTHNEASLDELKANLPLNENSILRSLNYWLENGLIDNSPQNNAEEKINKSSIHLTHDEMSKAVLLNPELSTLLQESQVILGRELPLSESRVLIEIYQNYLPSVYGILNLESYWNTKVTSKKVITETLYTAREWNNLNLSSEKEYEDQIKLMERHDDYICKVSAILSLSPDSLTRKQKKTIASWSDDYNYDPGFVSEVLLRKSDATIPYINTVLKNWYKKGYKTISDTRDIPSNITDNNPTDDLSPLFSALLQNNKR